MDDVLTFQDDELVLDVRAQGMKIVGILTAHVTPMERSVGNVRFVCFEIEVHDSIALQGNDEIGPEDPVSRANEPLGPTVEIEVDRQRPIIRRQAAVHPLGNRARDGVVPIEDRPQNHPAPS